MEAILLRTVVDFQRTARLYFPEDTLLVGLQFLVLYTIIVLFHISYLLLASSQIIEFDYCCYVIPLMP
jgi:hypothetical protein